MSRSTDYLYRYTHLESLRNILCTKSLTLLDFQQWDDTNDSYFMSLYMKNRRLKFLLALCFTSAWEKFHFWNVFGSNNEEESLKGAEQPLERGSYNGSSPLAAISVRIRFDRSQLIEAINKQREVFKCSDIEYLTHGELEALANGRKSSDPISKLPFIKRKGFQDESEFRIIYESNRRSVSTKDISIPMSCIKEITFSYKLNHDNYTAIRKTLLSMKECKDMKIGRSNIIGSKAWKAAGDAVVTAARQKRQAHRK